MRSHAKAVAAAALFILLIGVGQAAASSTRLATGTVGSHTDPHALTVDQSNGDVYVLDTGSSTVSRYDSSGNPSPFPALNGSHVINGSDAGSDNDATPQNGFAFDSSSQVAVDSSGTATDGNVYVASTNNNVISVFDSTGSYAGQLEGVGTNSAEPAQTWLESFAYPCGVATDSAGRLYVATAFDGQIDRYDPAGAIPTDADLDAQITDLPFGTCGLALDGAGNPHATTNVSGSPGVLTRYAASDFPSAAPAGTVIDPTATALAVDLSNGDVFATDGAEVTQYAASGALIGSFGPGTLTSSQGVALDRSPTASNGSLYAGDTPTASVYRFGPYVTLPEATIAAASDLSGESATLHGEVNPDGVQADYRFEYRLKGASDWIPLADADAGSGTAAVPVEAMLSGLSAASAYEARLVAENANGSDVSTVAEFQTLGSAPDAETRPAIEVTSGSATLRGRIDPNGLQTTYYFEYGTDTGYGQKIPLAPASLGAGNEQVPVSRAISDLTAATTYHFRIVAANPGGEAPGADATFTTDESGNLACPNEKIRTEQGSQHLPDCRAYEMVTPLDKGGSDVNGDVLRHFSAAAPDGNAFVYSSVASFADAPGAALPGIYKASRAPNGWSTIAVSPPQKATLAGGLGGGNTSIVYPFTADLSRVVVRTNAPLAPGATPDTAALYLRDLTSSQPAYDLLTPGLVSDATSGSVVYFRDATPDYSHVTFQTTKALTPDAPVGNELKAYVSSDEGIELVSYLPGPGKGIPSIGNVGTHTTHGQRGGQFNAISDDGRYVFFQPDRVRGLYRRDLLTNTTIEIVDPEYGFTFFVGATADGMSAYYIGQDGACVRHFADETEDCIAGYAGPTLGLAEDLSWVYQFGSGYGGGPLNERAIFYLRPETGEVTVAAELEGGTPGGAFGVVDDTETERRAAVTPDGDRFVFMTDATVPPFENNGFTQVYLYDASEDELRCISCPEGKPTASAGLSGISTFKSSGINQEFFARPRSISDDGRRIFFETGERLLPGDTNSRDDVYMWEEGELKLLSTGTSEFNARFLDASASGDDAFIVTKARLSGHDTDTLADVYDVRVGGGYPEPVRRLECLGDSCQAPPVAPNDPTPASAGFNGAGNVRERGRPRCPAGKRAAKRAGKPRCVRKRAGGVKRKAAKRRQAEQSTRRHG